MSEADAGSAPRARVGAWLLERFGPKMWLLYGVLYLASLLFGRSLVTPGPISLGLEDLAGGAAALALFLFVRVVDEHKDYEQDLVAKPESVLARGEVALGHLRFVGSLALVFVLGAMAWFDRGVGVSLLSGGGVIAWVFALALFTGEWLERRFLLLTAVHLASFSLAILWLVQLGARPTLLPLGAAWLVLHSLLAAAAFEVTRKTYGPEGEPAEAPSFSKRWGPSGGAGASALLLLAGGVTLVVVLRGLGLGPSWWVAAACNYALPLWALGRFAKAPEAPRAYKRNQGCVALALLGSHALVATGVAVERGLTWS